VFAIDCQHSEQSESVHNTYISEQDAQSMLIESEDMNYDTEQIEQNDEDVDLAKEHFKTKNKSLTEANNKLSEVNAHLYADYKKSKDELKHRNTVEYATKMELECAKLRGDCYQTKWNVKDFKTKNKSLTEANNKLSEVNAHLYADYKKSKDELKRRNTVEYATEMELECAKLRGELISNEMERKRYSEKDTHVINCLKQTVSELQHKLSTHQDTISVLTQQKDAQIKLYKTREDKDIEKVIDLENKVKVLDNIVYKTGQSVQTMNMLNNKCRTSFVKPRYLKKAKQANPRLYDIGCYNDNLVLMLSKESDEVIRLEKESRSKLSDLVRPFDYANLNSLDDLFVPQREKSPEQRFFSELSRLNEVPNLQCDYLELLEKYECLEKELSKSKIMLKSFKALQKHAINLEIDLQQCQEYIKNDKYFKENQSKEFCKEREQYFEIQDLKAQLQDKGIAIRVIPTTGVSRPQLKSNPQGDRVLRSNSRGKKLELIEIVLFIIDSGCSKHMTGNLKLPINFVEKKSTCFIRDLKGNDLLTGSRGTDLYSITLQSTSSPNPICLMAKATSSQAWLWHRKIPMFDELLNGSSKVVSKSSAVSAADASYQSQQPTTPLNNHTTPAPTCQTPPITPSVISSENINQAEPHAKNDEVAD
nr:integrase, catalytic region, zinc finger, CCHC-type, peptidase aspartic, catalytic [Tanacetum cinerariifolium]